LRIGIDLTRLKYFQDVARYWPTYSNIVVDFFEGFKAILGLDFSNRTGTNSLYSRTSASGTTRNVASDNARGIGRGFLLSVSASDREEDKAQATKIGPKRMLCHLVFLRIPPS